MYLFFNGTFSFDGVWNAMDYWKVLGKIILVDLDDGYSCIPASNPAFPHWILNTVQLDPVPVKALEEGLRHADALIAPNEVILKDWAHVVKGYFWANYPSVLDYEDRLPREASEPDSEFSYPRALELRALAPDELPPLLKKPRAGSEGQIVIGWGGSISHLDSFVYSGVIEGLARVLTEFPNVVFKFCGNDDRLDPLWKKLPEKQFIRQPGVLPRSHWPVVVSTFNIGIAPMDMRLVEGQTESNINEYSYDERRSWLKIGEYLCAGVPFVATDCQPYRELARCGKLVQNTGDAWYEALKSRVEGLAFFREEALKNRKWALKKMTIESNADRLIRLYMRIGEEAQAKAGLKVPLTAYVDPKPEDAVAEEDAVQTVTDAVMLHQVDRVPVEAWQLFKMAEEKEDLRREIGSAPYSGDPRQVGRAAYSIKASKIATDLGKQNFLTIDGVDVGSVWEYPLLIRLNTIFEEHERKKQE